MSFFKGYIRLVGKKPIDSFKDTDELLELEQVKSFPSYGGVLADGWVLIDVDDAEQAEKLYEIVCEEGIGCQVRQTTRGKHFYFKANAYWEKCGGGKTLAIGFKADIKVGGRNSYACLKKDGVVRHVIYDIEDGDTYDEPPVWMRLVHSKIDLKLKEGEGRNDALFRYIMPLQSAGFTKDEIRETLRIVNEYIFDEPLSKSEFETITRDEAFETNLVPSFYAGKVFLFDEFAKYLVREYHIKRINGALHIYKDGVYVHGYREIERAMIELIPNLSKAKRGEVLDYIEVFVGSESSQADAHLVAFKNGILNVITEELVGFSPDIVITNRIPWDYKPDAKCELVDKSLDKLACGDAAIRALLEECAGYCFYRRNELRKAFIFTGEKANGKSTYIAVISKMLGEENVSSLDFKELGDRFSTETMFRKLANLGDDIDDEFISSSAMFKKLVSGERIKAEKKGQDPFFFVPYVKFIFSANNLPRLRDRTGAVIDRLVVIPFNAKFTKNDPDYRPFIKYELCQQDAIERLIVLGIQGLRRVLESNAFTISSAVEKEIREYDELNNPIQLFFRELNEEDLCRETVAHWYEEYLGFCAANQIKSLSRIEFGRQVLKQFPNVSVVVAKIDGKATRCYRLKLH